MITPKLIDGVVSLIQTELDELEAGIARELTSYSRIAAKLQCQYAQVTYIVTRYLPREYLLKRRDYPNYIARRVRGELTEHKRNQCKVSSIEKLALDFNKSEERINNALKSRLTPEELAEYRRLFPKRIKNKLTGKVPAVIKELKAELKNFESGGSSRLRTLADIAQANNMTKQRVEQIKKCCLSPDEKMRWKNARKKTPRKRTEL